MTDPIADMLTRVRNAVQGKHQKVDMPASRLKSEIARILKEEGYIAHYKTAEEEGKPPGAFHVGRCHESRGRVQGTCRRSSQA